MIAAGDLAVYRRGRTAANVEMHPAEVESVQQEHGRARIWWRDKVGILRVSTVKLDKLERLGGGLAGWRSCCQTLN